jgi:hypothetical protein
MAQARGGRYREVLPRRLIPRYEAGWNNPALLSVRDDLAVSEARLGELFLGLGSGETGAVWLALREAMAKCSAAMAAGDAVIVQILQRALERYVSSAREKEEVLGYLATEFQVLSERE